MTDDLERSTSREVAQITEYRWRKTVPEQHRSSLDTRLVWLWNQRFGTVQMVYQNSPDILDKTAATLILQAIMGRDLVSIKQILQRLEGGALHDDEVMESSELPL